MFPSSFSIRSNNRGSLIGFFEIEDSGFQSKMEVKFGIESTHRMWYVKNDYQD